MTAVITGLGIVTALGDEVPAVLDRILRGDRAILQRTGATAALCPYSATVEKFDAERYFPDNKTLRLMGRDAQMATVAARKALQDAGLTIGDAYQAEDVGLFGAAGLSSMPTEEIARLVRDAAAQDGSFDLSSFGQTAIRRVRPVLSFKILANMPICFVSIFENLRGPNAIFSPWEGHGAQAIVAGVQAIEAGDVSCALVGACDVKTHSLSIVSLSQLGVLDSWRKQGVGAVPGEGAAFFVLESAESAVRRGAKIYAKIAQYSQRSRLPGVSLTETLVETLRKLRTEQANAAALAGDGDPVFLDAENDAMCKIGVTPASAIRPKSHLGNLYAAAAAMQIALAAEWLFRRDSNEAVLANCFGFGTEQASFVLEAP